MRRSRLGVAAAVALAVLPATAQAAVPQAIDLRVTSDPGDAVGWTATVTDPATIDTSLTAKGAGIVATVPDTVGSVILQLRPPAGQALHTGTYANATNSATAGAAPGLVVVRTGAPGTCLTATGSFTISTLDLIGTAIGRARASFEFHCNGGVTAVRGTLRIVAGIVTGTAEEGDTTGVAVAGNRFATNDRGARDIWRVRYRGRTIRSPKARESTFAYGFFGSSLVIQRADATSHLWLYSPRTRKFRRPPRGVNTRGWDWGGSVSAGSMQVLHGADNDVGRKTVALVQLSTGRSRTVARVGGRSFFEPGQVNGRYSVYDVCTPTTCDVVRYDRVTRSHLKAPRIGPFQYASAVAGNGTVYFVRSGSGCGVDAAIYAWRPGSAAVRIAITAPNDIANLQVGTWSGRPTIFGTLDHCADRGHGDLVEVPLLPLP